MPKSRRISPVPWEGDGDQNPRFRVLLVEDDRVDQIVFRKFVKDAELPYECTIAGSVAEAQDVLRWSAPFDIVVSDYLLGDGTAFDILDLVQEAPVILVTGAGGEETAVRAWKAGAYDFLVKDARGDYLKALAITVENAIAYRRAKKELELLSGAIMSAQDCIYLTDLQGKILFVNGAFCRTYGYTRSQVLGKDSSILWTGGHPCTPTGCVVGIPTAGGGSAVGFHHERQDGRRFPVSLSRSIIKDSSGKDVAVVGIARDLSEQIRLMDEFCLEITHLEADNERYKGLTITVLETLDGLLERGDSRKALRIIMDFREILAIERKGIPLARTGSNLGSLISEVAETLRAAAAEKDIELAVSMPEVEVAVQADRDHTVRALTCIGRSLIYAVPARSSIRIRVQDIEDAVTVAIESNDTIGAIRKIHKAMDGFDPFGGHSAPHGDLVLGLFVAKRLVELHGGTVGGDRSSGQDDILLLTLPKSKGVSRDSALVSARADQP